MKEVLKAIGGTFLMLCAVAVSLVLSAVPIALAILLVIWLLS